MDGGMDEWMDCTWVRDLAIPMHLGLNLRALCGPCQIMGAP